MERSGNMYNLGPDEAFNALKPTREGYKPVIRRGPGIVRVEVVIPDGENSAISLQWGFGSHSRLYIRGLESFEKAVFKVDPEQSEPR